MKRLGFVALLTACALAWCMAVPAAAASEFYIRIQGPKPVRVPALTGRGGGAAIAFENDLTIGSATGGAGTGKVKFGEITITKEPKNSGALSSAIAGGSPESKPVNAAPLMRQTVTVGCAGFEVQADYGKGPVHGVLASQSVDGLCIFAVPMSASPADAIVRVGLSSVPPGWSFNSQPQSRCIRAGETLDGALAETQAIFSFQWSPVRAAAPGAPCGRT
ncbi:MAG: hypothetical protein JO219_02965 [Candidatus Eremiobacteraeota bacterium]|nr:hypothetical protein [Candidatus Eremiobacteraeota bacterium]MBV8364870.1 hypothetical protein [Candidatus Eremiobacteraeota bacterium]